MNDRTTLNYFDKYKGNKMTEVDHDPVQKPNHYQQGEMETIEVIKGSMTRNQYIGYLKGNIIKYICRAEYKNGKEDLGKASKYMQWLSEVI